MKGFVVAALFAFVAACQFRNLGLAINLKSDIKVISKCKGWALSDEEKAAIGKLYTECVSSTKVDEAQVKKLRAGEDVEDEKLVKYVGCMFLKLKFVTADGKLQEENIRAKIPSDFSKDEANKIITECKEVSGDGYEKISFAAYKCFLKKTTKLIEF